MVFLSDGMTCYVTSWQNKAAVWAHLEVSCFEGTLFGACFEGKQMENQCCLRLLRLKQTHLGFTTSYLGSKVTTHPGGTCRQRRVLGRYLPSQEFGISGQVPLTPLHSTQGIPRRWTPKRNSSCISGFHVNQPFQFGACCLVTGHVLTCSPPFAYAPTKEG